MGSKFGNSTTVPTCIASTWGVNVLFFCIMRACAGDRSKAPLLLSGSNEITTPEKSWRLRTAASRESFSSTLPVTVAQSNGSTPMELKQVRQSQVIVIVQAGARADVAGSSLRGLQPRQHVGPQPVNEIRCIGLVLSDASKKKVRIAVVLLAA